MRHSVLVQRVYGVVVIALAFTAIFTALTYSILSRAMFTNIKAAELLPKARALSKLVSTSYDDENYHYAMREVLGEMDDDASLLGAYFIIVDANGHPVLSSEGVSLKGLNGAKDMIEQMLSGQETQLYSKWIFSQLNVVSVGTPIFRDDTIIGGVLVFVPLYEAMAASSSMNSALLLSLFIIMPLTLLLIYLFAGRMAKPLRQMKDVAISMAEGDYQVRANDEQRGEMGQLARSLNHLSQELYRNISELTMERNRLRQSVDGLKEGFVSVDSLGRIEHYNPAVKRMFSLLPPAGKGRQMELIPNEAVWDDFRAAIDEKSARTRQVEVLDRLIRITITPLIDENQNCVGAVGLFTDITEQERLERTRRDYVANVSHELRSPLTAMRALLEPMHDGMVRDEATIKRYYDILLRETMRLSRLINDLMELSRLQSGTLSLDREEVSLDEMLSDLAERYRLTAEDQGKHFELRCDPAACPPVITNEDRTEQILVILLDNAMKYTPDGGLVYLDGRWDGDKVVLMVGDTGVGIAPEDQPYVFDRFYKVDKSHGSSGSGLGLSIAKEILQAMGETIRVQSEPGKGSVFSFTLTKAAGQAG
ncbi:MAG: ATP-binding protein [Eubacteriales bacterium]|nr:ATP-binding protein [Eubacteriales bacterium]